MDDGSRPEITLEVPEDFRERCRAARAKREAGIPMTVEQLADELGLSFEFLSACVGVAEALATGRPVLIDPANLPKPN